jgi:hypothetical protein
MASRELKCTPPPAEYLFIRYVALIGFRGLMLQALFEKHNSFLRPLKKKGFKEERVTTIGWYDIGKSHDTGIQQEPGMYALRDDERAPSVLVFFLTFQACIR